MGFKLTLITVVKCSAGLPYPDALVMVSRPETDVVVDTI